MEKPNLSTEEIQLAQSGMAMLQKGAELIPADALDALYKWAKWWAYYQDFLKNKSEYELKAWTEDRRKQILHKCEKEHPAEYDDLTWQDRAKDALLEKLEIWMNDYSDQCTFDEFDGNWISCDRCGSWTDDWSQTCICYAR